MRLLSVTAYLFTSRLHQHKLIYITSAFCAFLACPDPRPCPVADLPPRVCFPIVRYYTLLEKLRDVTIPLRAPLGVASVISQIGCPKAPRGQGAPPGTQASGPARFWAPRWRFRAILYGARAAATFRGGSPFPAGPCGSSQNLTNMPLVGPWDTMEGSQGR